MAPLFESRTSDVVRTREEAVARVAFQLSDEVFAFDRDQSIPKSFKHTLESLQTNSAKTVS
jgi:hypothetical protein